MRPSRPIRWFLMGVAVLACVTLAEAQTSTQQSATRLDVAVGAVHSHTTNGTLTITPTGSNYVYITGIDISNCATGSAVSAATPTYITVTGLPGTAPQWQMGSGVTAGLCQPTVTPVAFSGPLKSASPGVAVVFTLPAFATNQVISMNVYYYTGP